MAPKKKSAKKKATKIKAKKKISKNKPTKAKKSASPKKTSLLDKIASHRREIEKAKSKSEKDGEKLFKQAVKQIFSEFPKVQSFSWREYTPYWNDGDSCVFGCHFESLEMQFTDGTEDSEDVWTLQHLSELLSGDIEKKKKEIAAQISKVKEDWEKNNLKSKLKDLDKTPEEIVRIKEVYEIKRTIVDFLEGIDESVYESMFGEGTVVVSREEIRVEECEHD